MIRTGPIGEELTVFYRIGGTASNGDDYDSLSGSVTIPADCSCAPINIHPIDDKLVEGNETVIVALEQPLVWPPPYLVSWPGIAVVGIEDNDTINNQPPRVAIVNPPDGAVFVSPVDITIAAKAWDQDGRVRTVEFFANGQSLGVVTNRPIILDPVPVEDGSLERLVDLQSEDLPDLYPDVDFDLELNATIEHVPGNHFRIVWPNAPPGTHTLTAVATDNRGASTTSNPVTITVTDPPIQPIVNIITVDPVGSEPDSNSTRRDTALFKVHRSGDLSIPLEVFYRVRGTAENGIDYAEIPNRVLIAPGERSAPILIQPLDDRLVEGTESVVIQLVPPICVAIFPPPPDCYRVGRHDTARAAILDNDEPNLPPVVRLVHPADGDTFLAPADIKLVAAARDFDGHVTQVEFFEGTNSLGVVTNKFDTLDPYSPAFVLPWLNVPPGRYVLSAEATDNQGATSLSRPVEIKVLERQPPPVVTVRASDGEASEGPRVIGGGGGDGGSVGVEPNVDTATFHVHRSGNTDDPLEVFYSLHGSAENGEDYRTLSGRVTIPSGANSANVVVVPIDDDLCEGTESVVLRIEPPVCIAIFPPPPHCYVVGSQDSSFARILDNDVCNTNQPPKVDLVKPENGSIFTAPADIELVALAGDSDGRVRSVEFFEGNTSLGVVTNNSATGELFKLLWPNVGAGSYSLRAKATDNEGAMTLSEPVLIRVIDVVRLPIVTIEATDPIASEGRIQLEPGDTYPIGGIQENATAELSIERPIIIDTASFTVRREGFLNIPLTVFYQVRGTASNGVDYEMLSGEVTIPEGSETARITVIPCG